MMIRDALLVLAADINECNLPPAKCSGTSSDCVNTNGSFHCTCTHPGYELQLPGNNTCVGKLVAMPSRL